MRPTTTGATTIAIQNPVPAPNGAMMLREKYAPSANSSPWEKLITSITPKMTDSPAANRT